MHVGLSRFLACQDSFDLLGGYVLVVDGGNGLEQAVFRQISWLGFSAGESAGAGSSDVCNFHID